MFGLKKQWIKNYIGLRIVRNEKGKLVLGSSKLNKVQEEYTFFEEYVKKYIMMIGGVESIDVSYVTGEVTIKYDPEVLASEDLIRWVQVVYHLLIDHIEDIQKNWEKDPTPLDEKLIDLLNKSLRRFR